MATGRRGRYGRFNIKTVPRETIYHIFRRGVTPIRYVSCVMDVIKERDIYLSICGLSLIEKKGGWVRYLRSKLAETVLTVSPPSYLRDAT